jgi:RHS repeat-associated protein
VHDGTGATTLAYNDKGIVTRGAWSDVSGTEEGLTGFKKTTDSGASLKFLFFGSANIALNMGQGPDHSLFDVYVDGSLWQTFDAYAASAGARAAITIAFAPTDSAGPHTLEIRNRSDRHRLSTGTKLRFKSLTVDGLYDLHTIEYAYDKLLRLLEARYNPGLNTAAADADLLRRYQYTFDRMGNRLSQSIAINGAAPTVTNYTYNGANQLTAGGATYDNNGNLTHDGTLTYTWDRANRMKSLTGAGGTISNTSDGLGNRLSTTFGAGVPYKFLLDLQPGLPVMLMLTQGASTNQYLHGPRGILAEKRVGNWEPILQDGLGSGRVKTDNTAVVQGTELFDPYGNSYSNSGTSGGWHGFTGEVRDGNFLYLRARHYETLRGTFPSRDPYEGTPQRPMSLNGYSYVEGNVVNLTDPSGRLFWSFPRGGSGRKEDLYNPSQYTYNPSDRSCRKVFAHSWVSYWLERNNGDIWNTHTEFGRGMRIDNIVFEEYTLQASITPTFEARTAAKVYEIEPATSLSMIALGYVEISLKHDAISRGFGSFQHTGSLPSQDAWNPSRNVSPFTSANGGRYDFTQVLTWEKGDQLSPVHGRGPVRVDPNELGATGIPDAYWIFLPVDGLVLYVSECDLLSQGVNLTAAAITNWFLDRYERAQRDYQDDRRTQGNPLPNPQVPRPATAAPVNGSALLGIGALCLAGLVIVSLFPETLPVLIPIAGRVSTAPAAGG